MGGKSRRLALVASKGTLDQAYPSLILATTAASMGWEAGIYFTFHGLDIILRKIQGVHFGMIVNIHKSMISWMIKLCIYKYLTV